MSFNNTVTALTNLTVTSNTLFPCSEASARNEITAANLLAGLSVVTGGTVPASYAPSSTAWLAFIDADSVSGSDGDAVSSLALSYGSTSAFTQATGANRPLLKTGANGLNGHNGVLFDKSNDSLNTTTGGAGLTGSWYVAAVCKFTGAASTYENVLSWGDAGVTGKRRSLARTPAGNLVFLGENADVNTTTALAGGTAYLLEAAYDGSSLTLRVNGTVVKYAAASFVAYSSAVLRLGTNNGGTEPFGGSLYLAAFLGSVPSVPDQIGLRSYVAARYGLTIANSTRAGHLPVFTADRAVDIGAVFQTGQNIVFGGLVPLSVGSSYAEAAASWTGTAAVTVNGSLACLGAGSEHLLARDGGDNVGAVWSKQAFSALRYLSWNGSERGALGVAWDSAYPFGGPNGSMYCEFSNFEDAGLYGDYREVQTNSGGTAKVRRRVRDDTYAIEEYDFTAAATVANAPTTGLVKLNGRPVTSTANDGTLDTNITTGATQCGLVVVKDATNSKCAVYRLENATLTLVSADAEFSTTQGTASKVNVYANSGQIRLENKTGGALSLTAAYYGA
ncbi:hypothetical protein [Gemmata sp.]|uniref:hypothetical protein n=1 Tax=Gemmata sp. TaxID=1914242 RepID=UPI003F6F3C8F